MKKIYTIVILLSALRLAAQPYNNEWIDYSKTYYKFKVGATGLYRIPQPVVAAAGLGGVPVQNFQLFRNGQEVPIYTTVSSGVLGATDYIEFWGKMNDGVPDVPLYRSSSYQHTTNTSLETDTAVYFLTVNPTGSTFHFVDVANNVAGSLLTPEPFFMYTSGSYFRSGGINPGFAQVVGEYIYSSSYDIGEMWSSPAIAPGTPFADTKNNLFVYSGGPNASIKFGLVGTAENARSVQLTVNGSVVLDTTMNSFYDVQSTKTVPMSLISGNTATINYINNSTVTTDRMVASFYELNYPRQFNFGGQANFPFQLAARSAGYLLNISNFAISPGATPILYDLTNGLRYTGVVNGSTVSFALTGSTASYNLILVNEDPAGVQTVTGLTSKTFEKLSLSANQSNYVIISNPVLYNDGTNDGVNPVMDYKNYRSSASGGSWNAQIYDINELVDQFGFGIKMDPLSIQNFLRYARANWSIKPQFVFLIGHGMCYNDYNSYGEQNHNPVADRLNLVPTYGYPASDNKLSGNNGVDAVPVTPIGRLSVVSGTEIENYLAKVKEYELAQVASPNTIDGRLWMKNILHLTGVSEPYLGTIICNYMYGYQQIISDTLFGANVSTLCDGNASPVAQVPPGYITTLFQNGFSMMNYFGHSSSSTLAYDLDNPNAYNNAGKYPVFYLNGCDAGDFYVYDALRFLRPGTVSESYVLAPERGAIASVASTHFSIVNYLNILLTVLYNEMDAADYGKPISVIEKDALQGLVNTAPGDFFARQHAEQMSLLGDPAVRLNQQALPDYDIESSQVLINPSFISVSNTSFAIKARFYNLGRAVRDSISVLVTRKYPNGTSVVLLKKRIRGIDYADSVSLNVPIVATRDKGQNYITVTINSDNDVQEVTTNNNSVTSGVYIYEEGVSPVYPYNYALINNNVQKLYASTADPFSPSAQYEMQIDTTTLFNSPSLVTKYVTSTGGVLEFDPGITYQDSVVYYWRVSKVPATGGTYTWNGFSFTYFDPNSSSTGENQSHFYQHTQSMLNGIYLDSTSRKFNFTPVTNTLIVKNGVFPTAANQAQDCEVIINGNPNVIQSFNGISTIYFNVFDPITFHPWYNTPTGTPGRYGSISPAGPTREYDFIYNILDTAQRRAAMNFLDLIPSNDYVVVYNCSYNNGSTNTYASTWAGDTSYLGSGNSMYARLKTQGFNNIDSFYFARAFIFVYQKNNMANFPPQSVFSQGVNDKISLTANYITPDSVGVIVSPSLGPARKWKQLHWRGGSLESPYTDSVQVQVMGVDTSGNVSPPLFTLGKTGQDLDISSINASQYPWLKLQMTTTDTLNGTPYQLKYWRLTYDPVPEGALAPNIFSIAPDTVQLGQPINFGIAFKNISPTPFDSLQLVMTLKDKSNVTHNITLSKTKPLVSGDTVKITYPIDTKTLSGLNNIYLNVNPNYAQPEQYLFNNFLYKNFYVSGESRAPQLDVTFDNVHILNDDIVSAKPHIQVRLTSLSQYILLTDTSSISVQVKYPDGSIHTFSFNSDTLRFTPATNGSNNTATVDFYPVFTKQYNPQGDIYELTVSGKDALGNQAGATPYKVDFKVITKPMISNMLNYPNPFTTSTAFVFTITGSDVPQNIKIQIMTITGKVVREITKEELGPLHVGQNITEFKWNGTDMYGQRLANGVYLYHVVTNLNGQSLSKYQAAGDNTDKFFNNGYGKMYLMGH
jgi:flagellar hook assembly protein FlgD